MENYSCMITTFSVWKESNRGLLSNAMSGWGSMMMCLKSNHLNNNHLQAINLFIVIPPA